MALARIAAPFLLLAACHRASPPATARADTGASASAQPVGHGARIVVDTSQSNRGFAAPGSVALETLHRTLDAALSSAQLNNPFARCRLDTTLHCPSTPLAPSLFRAPATYDGRAAALDTVLRPESLDPYAITVLVTDGFQSSNAPTVPDASDAIACSAGADPACIGALLRRRADEGYGVWIVRLVMRFSGRYFAERRLDAQTFERVQLHVTSLAGDPAWDGVHFAASAPDYASESGPFTFTGARPLLLFVLSRDIARTRHFVDDLVSRLRVERITARGSDEDVASAEWAPLEGFTARIDRARRLDQGGVADDVVLDRATRTPTALEQPVHCSLRGRARVTLEGAITAGDPAPPLFVTTAFSWRLENRTSLVATPTEPLAPGPIHGTATIDCTTATSGTSHVALGVWGQWSIDDHAFEDVWYARESGDTSFETPERVFGLASIARAVLDSATNRAGFLDRVNFAIERE